MSKQKGAALVEFAIVALVFFVIVFGIIEFARAFFVYNTLVEATRRGARVAAICAPYDIDGSLNKIQNIVLFDDPSAGSPPGVLGLTYADITVNYLTNNLTLALNAGPNPIDNITFVQVCIGTNSAALCDTTTFDHTLIIPLFGNTFNMPVFSTTLPAESLGRLTNKNPLPAGSRVCF